MDEKNFKDLVIYFTRYVNCRLIKIMSLQFQELMVKIEEHKGKKYLMIYDYMVDKALQKVKKNTYRKI